MLQQETAFPIMITQQSMRDNFNVTAGVHFSNATVTQQSVRIASMCTAGNYFYNYATINANDFNVTAGLTFSNEANATISADNFNVTAGDFYNYDSATISADNFNVTAGADFYNDRNATISANYISISANSFINSHTEGDGSITADTLSLSVAGDFDYANDFLGNGNINANNQYFTIRNGDFSNNTSIALAGNLGITANDFINTGGSITADTLNLSVAGDFDYADNYLNNGNIDVTIFNLQVGGDFSYNDANNDFVLNENDNLVVLGNASITADNYSQSGAIDVIGYHNWKSGLLL